MENEASREEIERKFGKPLKDIMYDLCVNQGLSPSRGAEILGVREKTFKYWRNHFRLGPIQRACDSSEEIKRERTRRYEEQLENIDIRRPFLYMNEVSLNGFRECIERFLELTKAEVVHDNEGLVYMQKSLEVAMLEEALKFVDRYMSGELINEYKLRVRALEENS